MNTSKDKNTIKAEQFDQLFMQEQNDIVNYLDVKSVKVRYPVQRISIDFPKNIVAKLDNEAAKIGITRTSLIKMWIAQELAKQQPTAN